jgi:phenylacetate-CoA ligase
MSVKGCFHDQREETASVDALRALQNERLRGVLRYVYNRNTTQRARFRAAGITPEDIRGLEDLPRIPLMTKADFRAGYPLGMSCVDKKAIVEMHMSSGSTGSPIVMPYTQADLEQWTQCMARCLRMAGAQPADVIQITPSFGLFNGGFGFYHGAEELGLFVLPTGAGNTQRQVRLAKDFGTRIITGVVSYAIRLMEVLHDLGEDLPDLEIGMFGAETFSDSMKEKIAEGLGIEVFDIYGMTETGGVGTLGMDCPAHEGIHVWEDQYIVEILDPHSGRRLPDGEFGELVVTSLTREALPVIRFRTADLTRVVSRAPCACGRTHVRIAPIAGRTDDMIIVKGVNFFPRQIEEIVMGIQGIGVHYQIVIEETDGIQDLYVNVEGEPGVTWAVVAKQLRDALGFTPKGDVFPRGHLPRQEGKAKRVFYRDAEGDLH